MSRFSVRALVTMAVIGVGGIVWRQLRHAPATNNDLPAGITEVKLEPPGTPDDTTAKTDGVATAIDDRADTSQELTPADVLGASVAGFGRALHLVASAVVIAPLLLVGLLHVAQSSLTEAVESLALVLSPFLVGAATAAIAALESSTWPGHPWFG